MQTVENKCNKEMLKKPKRKTNKMQHKRQQNQSIVYTKCQTISK